MAADVLDHHDGVVDDKAGGDRQRHQRQVVEAVAARYITPNVPISETGTATLGMIVARRIPQKQKDHQDHQADRKASA